MGDGLVGRGVVWERGCLGDEQRGWEMGWLGDGLVGGGFGREMDWLGDGLCCDGLAGRWVGYG